MHARATSRLAGFSALLVLCTAGTRLDAQSRGKVLTPPRPADTTSRPPAQLARRCQAPYRPPPRRRDGPRRPSHNRPSSIPSARSSFTICSSATGQDSPRSRPRSASASRTTTSRKRRRAIGSTRPKRWSVACPHREYRHVARRRARSRLTLRPTAPSPDARSSTASVQSISPAGIAPRQPPATRMMATVPAATPSPSSARTRGGS